MAPAAAAAPPALMVQMAAFRRSAIYEYRKAADARLFASADVKKVCSYRLSTRVARGFHRYASER